MNRKVLEMSKDICFNCGYVDDCGVFDKVVLTLAKDDIKKKFNIVVCKDCTPYLFTDKNCETCRYRNVLKHKHPCNMCIHRKDS